MAGVGIMSEHIDLAVSDTFAPGFYYQELHQRYAGSIYGQYHATQLPRFSQNYGYDPDQMIGDLGDDVHPVRHMAYTEASVAVPFITTQLTSSHEHFNRQQIIGLRLAAILHDIGESQHPAITEAVGVTVGDVWFESKQTSDAQQEVLIRHFLYGQLYADIPPVLLEQAEEAIENGDCSSGLAFNTIERLGYYKTAVKAGELALKLRLSREEREEPSRRFTNLARLALRVSDNHRTILQERAELFPHADWVLRFNARRYERIHSVLPDFVQQAAGQTT